PSSAPSTRSWATSTGDAQRSHPEGDPRAAAQVPAHQVGGDARARPGAGGARNAHAGSDDAGRAGAPGRSRLRRGRGDVYSLFHLEPVGKHHLYVCNNLSCQLRGAEELLTHIKESIGVSEYGQVSADGLFSVEPVECLGACEYAPMLRADHRFHYDLTPAKIDALLKEWRGDREGKKARKEAHPRAGSH